MTVMLYIAYFCFIVLLIMLPLSCFFLQWYTPWKLYWKPAAKILRCRIIAAIGSFSAICCAFVLNDDIIFSYCYIGIALCNLFIYYYKARILKKELKKQH